MFTNHTFLNLFGRRSPHSGGRCQTEQQTVQEAAGWLHRCWQQGSTEALPRGSGSAEQGAGVGCADQWSAGHGEREVRRCCPQPHTGASLHSQCCVYTKLSPWKWEATVNRSVPLSQGAPGDFRSQLTRASLHSLSLWQGSLVFRKTKSEQVWTVVPRNCFSGCYFWERLEKYFSIHCRCWLCQQGQ